MKLFRTLVAISVLAALSFVAGYGYKRWYAKPGTSDESQSAGRRILYYVDPMNPRYRSDKPGKALDGMDLVPVYEEDNPADSSGAPGEAASLPMGTIKITPEKQQLIGVRYGEVEFSSFVHKVRAVGKVNFDETRIARIHPRVEGWIDKVFVDFTGKLVEKDQPLLTIYSPELLATQQEFLLALKSKELMRSSPLEESLSQSDSLLAAARKRLELWELSESQIEEITRTEKPVTNITLNSPISGYVITRNAFPKQRVTPDTELYNVADLSRVWIMTDVFEYEAPMVQVGQPATVTISYYSGKSFRASVNYIQPQVDPMTRTLKIRLEAENPGLILKPDMFVNVEFQIGMPQRIMVSADAVLDSGLRQTVFVDRGNGFLEPRQVEVGQRLGDKLEILKGLQAGERIVISGNFLIDSESQLKSAAGGMAGMAHGGSTGGKTTEAAPPPSEHQQHGGPPNASPQPPAGAEHRGGHGQ